MPQISVPFLWEEKPGMPKEERTLDSLLPPPPQPPSSVPLPPPPMVSMPGKFANTTTPPPPPIPAKFVVSIPFKWEEKPGTPIQSFTQRPSLAAEDKCLPLPPAYYQFFECFDNDQESSFGDYDEEGEEPPSLLANRLVPVSAISSAIPFDSSQHAEVMDLEAPSAPESRSSTSSYETGNSFLGQLFPLYSPKACSPGKLVACSNFEISGSSEGVVQGNETQVKALPGEGEHSTAIRRPPTLGELIMLSRRRSYEQKAVSMRKTSGSKVFEEPCDLGCCMFGAGNGGLVKLLRGKSLLMLKFA